MAAFPSYTIVGLIGADHCDGGAIPGTDDATAISADASDAIKATLLKWFPAGVTITQV
jgi:hypothetical protein